MKPKTMIKKLTSALYWFLVIGGKFLQASPFGTTFSVILSFLSQLALIASMLLPLKIVMIMSSEQVPNFLPRFITQFGERPLIAGISALALISFAFYSLAGEATERLAKNTVKVIQMRNKKLVLFENQDALAENAYLKVSSALASVLFIVLGLIIIFCIYPELAGAIFGFINVLFFGSYLIYTFFPTQARRVSEKLNIYLNRIANIGFLAAFLFIVCDYMFSTIPGFLSVLGSLVLARQIFSQAALIVLSIYFVNHQKDKLKAIFFQGHAFNPPSHPPKNSVWQFLENPTWKRELTNATPIQALGNWKLTHQLKWLETGIKNILFLIAIPTSPDGEKYLIKIFDRRKSAEARHEATLLMSPPDNLPAPPLVSVTQIDEFHIHTFNIKGCQEVTALPQAKVRRKVAGQLLGVNLTSQMVSQYERSRTMLWDRVDQRVIQKLRAVLESNKQPTLDRFQNSLPTIKMRLKSMPLRIANQMARSELCLKDDKGMLLLTHWGSWSIDPMGAQYPLIRENGYRQTDNINQNNEDIENLMGYDINIDDFYLANDFRMLVTHLENERYYSAFKIIKGLLTLNFLLRPSEETTVQRPSR